MTRVSAISGKTSKSSHNAISLLHYSITAFTRGGGGGRTRLPKFKFSANFPIGSYMILQIQIKKNQKCLISYVKKNILIENPFEVQH